MKALETATRSKEKIPFFISPIQYFALLSHALGTSCVLVPGPGSFIHLTGILHPNLNQSTLRGKGPLFISGFH